MVNLYIVRPRPKLVLPIGKSSLLFPKFNLWTMYHDQPNIWSWLIDDIFVEEPLPNQAPEDDAKQDENGPPPVPDNNPQEEKQNEPAEELGGHQNINMPNGNGGVDNDGDVIMTDEQKEAKNNADITNLLRGKQVSGVIALASALHGNKNDWGIAVDLHPKLIAIGKELHKRVGDKTIDPSSIFKHF